MGSDDSPIDESTQQSDQELWALAHGLQINDTITINSQFTELTVTNVRPNADRGNVTEITLQPYGNDDHYTVTITNQEATAPTLITPNDDTVTVTSIKAIGNCVIAGTTARDIYGTTILDNSSPHHDDDVEEPGLPTVDAESLTIIGDCPSCDCLVAEHNNKAICTSCGAWCEIEQWNAYHDTSPTTDKDTETSDGSQTSLHDTWSVGNSS